MKKLNFASVAFNHTQTPISEQFDDIYFSTLDGVAESQYVFQEGNQIWEKWQHHSREFFVIAETGFGTGLNFLAVAQRFQQFREEFPTHHLKRLYFISFEKFPLNTDQLIEIHQRYPQFVNLSAQLTACWQPRQVGCQRYHFEQIYLDLWFGDITDNLPQLGDNYNSSIDCWFLDGFSPDKNPEMWSEQLYRQLFRLTRNGGSFATFTASSNVRRGLQAVGFEVKKRKGFGKKREMLWGEKPLASPDAPYEYPYFYSHHPDTNLNNTDIAIVGGGVASLFLALSLLERGKSVTLYCQDEQLAQNASGNLQGAIYPQLSDDDERNVRFYVHSFDYALQRLNKLAQAVDFEHDFTGVALYAYNEKTQQKLQKLAEQGWDFNLFQLHSAEQLTEKIGLPVKNGGAFIASGGWISPLQLVQNSFAYLETLGLKIILNHRVENPKFEYNKWHWQYQNQHFSHQILVLANGHTLTEFQQTAGIPLYPVRGQVSQVPTNNTLQRLKCVVCYDGYITPMSASQSHCIGASHLRDNSETTFSLIEHQQNLAKLQDNLTSCEWTKSIDISKNQGKVGIRSAFRDRIPMVGAVANFARQKEQFANLFNQRRRKESIEKAECYPNLYLLAGLGSRGLTTAPLLGELLASQICGEPQPLSQDILQALSPNRTWIRQLLRGRKID
ncbi:bifunctional tRNA (5-methylaminomethyl-2-thiouridylate)-methyltransferase MnmD/FAD-dependent cmnm(5)s(2)U34 oxidoreductase MnmC [Vespertiliibacter pulmonis]|uniref:tRNA 5-methylaminomethyl-2-thiouridine biosynthesis bifunctional protein MnmC n=1 Tax=Vespertiliibacter pulmonis TaxID=1443036 RepID=A0A3N4W0K4_9PAST|nr:bifunctional tRNA (5-methylaminomethyl-2-thiouridine)(34)-methyltransferase MnmD/FAD-dependent 5-carboxymethylaminomethyl-2-thiouridine(34) oxidoreductase MnmC [Vespertiliibacter pulmonis]QLB21444.1 bifunctional tRNA (5-methylaminomethyl-2-thiouridylate)-methyltransferase MnmD/FAD-dependent cmnm(5)s(2)U34 oxidoreductase MnmC [Vespertiliibacter pulmonis]RPE85859.1 tRNA 5-methylaminomethyl-2-thiouridine biosynthesis bifunctional protein [Vespertiliibacter pulmonis]